VRIETVAPSGKDDRGRVGPRYGRKSDVVEIVLTKSAISDAAASTSVRLIISFGLCM